MLEVREITKRFGGLMALDRASLHVAPGEIIGLIGPNGSGKTTLINIATGFLRPTAGEVWLSGQRIDGIDSHAIAARGLCRTFQVLRVFKRLTVLQNVVIGEHLASRRSGAWRATFGNIAESAQRAKELLALMGLQELAARPAGVLSAGHGRLLEIARALATRPRILLLDEPAAGLNSAERSELVKRITSIRGQGLGILLVEHDMRLVMQLCERIVVLSEGRLLAVGAPREIQSNPDVIAVYLGRAAL